MEPPLFFQKKQRRKLFLCLIYGTARRADLFLQFYDSIISIEIALEAITDISYILIHTHFLLIYAKQFGNNSNITFQIFALK